MVVKDNSLVKNILTGGIILKILRPIGKVVKTLLGKLSTRELYWTVLKYLGEVLSIALFKSAGEVVFGMGEVLKGESSWYKRELPRPNQVGTAASAFSSNTRPTYSGARASNLVPTSRGQYSAGEELQFPGFAS